MWEWKPRGAILDQDPPGVRPFSPTLPALMRLGKSLLSLMLCWVIQWADYNHLAQWLSVRTILNCKRATRDPIEKEKKDELFLIWSVWTKHIHMFPIPRKLLGTFRNQFETCGWCFFQHAVFSIFWTRFKIKILPTPHATKKRWKTSRFRPRESSCLLTPGHPEVGRAKWQKDDDWVQVFRQITLCCFCLSCVVLIESITCIKRSLLSTCHMF